MIGTGYRERWFSEDFKAAHPEVLEAPTLYVSGADDKLGGPPALMAGLAAKVPGARHVSVPNAAHIANIQNPEGFDRLLESFLQ